MARSRGRASTASTRGPISSGRPASGCRPTGPSSSSCTAEFGVSTRRSLSGLEVEEAVNRLYGADGQARLKSGEDFDVSYEIQPDRRTRLRFRVNATAVLSRGNDGAAVTARPLPNVVPHLADLGIEASHPGALQAARRVRDRLRRHRQRQEHDARRDDARDDRGPGKSRRHPRICRADRVCVRRHQRSDRDDRAERNSPPPAELRRRYPQRDAAGAECDRRGRVPGWRDDGRGDERGTDGPRRLHDHPRGQRGRDPCSAS